MLNKANKLMEQRNAMINEAREVLVVLGAEDAVVPMSQVVINKGRIVKVETVVEDNTKLNLLSEQYDLLDSKLEEAEMQCSFKDGQIIGLNNKIKELEEQLERAIQENRRHIGRINELAAEIETKDAIIDSLRKGAEVKKLEKKVKPLQDELKDYKEELEKEQPKTTTVNKTKKIKQQVEIEKQSSPGFVEGTLTIDKKDYKFIASNRFEKPVVLGVTDDEVIQQAKDLIIDICGKSIFTGYRGTEEELLYAEDKSNNLVAYCEQGVFKGFIDNYYFVWNPGYDVPVGCLIANKDNPRRPLRKLNRSWGPLFEQRAKDIMALCKTLNYINYDRERIEAEIGCYKPESASNDNEVVVDVVNDVNVMSEDEELDALDI